MTKKKKTFENLYKEAERQDDYWIARRALDFTEDVVRVMTDMKVTRAELARSLGTSQAYITKLLRGDVNFTLGTMVRLARALDAEFRISLCRKLNPSNDLKARASRTRLVRTGRLSMNTAGTQVRRRSQRASGEPRLEGISQAMAFTRIVTRPDGNRR